MEILQLCSIRKKVNVLVLDKINLVILHFGMSKPEECLLFKENIFTYSIINNT